MARKKIHFPNPSQSHVQFHWTSTTEYCRMISEANEQFNFGFTINEIQKLEHDLKTLPRQPDSLTPISVCVWPAMNLEKNWENLLNWLDKSLIASQNISIGHCLFTGDCLSFSESSRKYSDHKKILQPVMIDLKMSEISYVGNSGTWLTKSLGIEMVPFLAMNPQVAKLMDYRSLPNIRMPGIRLCGSLEPVLGYKDDHMFIAFETV